MSVEKYVGDFAVLFHKLKDIEKLDVLFALRRWMTNLPGCRSRISEVNAGVVATYVGGGGHSTAASATFGT